MNGFRPDPPPGFEYLEEPEVDSGTTAWATTFGYNDPIDNGVGAWGDNTNNPYLVGVSLPIHELRRRFGDDDAAHGKLVQVTNAHTGASIIAPIVDKGPANWVINRQGPTIDLTEGARKALGTGGKTPVTYAFVGDEYADQVTGPLPPEGYERVPPPPPGYEIAPPEGYEAAAPEAQPTPAPTSPKRNFFATKEEEAATGGKGPMHPDVLAAQNVRDKLFPGEDEYFKAHPEVAGMAAEDDKIILNPYSPSSVNKEAVIKNEGFRIKLRQSGTIPDFEITPEQKAAFKGTPYEKDEDALKQTIAARIYSGDPSAKATEEQKAWVQKFSATPTPGITYGPAYQTAAPTMPAQQGPMGPAPLATIKEPSVEEPKAKREVGFVESTVRGAGQSALGLSEAIARHGIAPVLSGLNQLIESTEKRTGEKPGVAANTIKAIDEYVRQRFVETPEAQRQELAIQPETEVQSVPGEVGSVVGNLIPDLVSAWVTAGGTKLPSAAVAAKEAAPTVLNAMKALVPKMREGAATFILPAAKAGMDAQLRAKEEGKSELQQHAAFLGNAIETMGLAAIPMSVESGAANVAARVLSRGAKGAAIGVAQSELGRAIEQRPFSAKETALGAIPAAGIAAVLGARARIRELSLTEKPPTPPTEKPPTPPEEFAPKQAAAEAAAKPAPAPKEAPPAAEPKAAEEEGVGVGFVPPGTGQFAAGIEIAKGLAPRIASEFRIKKLSPFLRILNEWGAGNQKNYRNTKAWVKEINQRVPDPVKREGIVNYIEAAGDMPTLLAREAASKNKQRKAGYRAAQQLTSDEIDVANQVIQKYKDAIDEGRKWGIEIPEAANYVTHLWKGQKMRTQNVKSLSDYFQFSRGRVFPDYFTGEQKGYVPESKDIGEVQGSYLLALGQAINNRKFVEALSKGLASDVRRLLWPKGIFRTVEQDDSKVHLIFPNQAMQQMVPGPKGEMVPIETSDYKTLQIPGLQNWRWVGEMDGNPVFQKSDLAVHPEIYNHLAKVLGNSMLRDWWNRPSDNVFHQMTKGLTRFVLDDFQRAAKETMFGFLSPFHQVQEGTHGVGHRINPFFNIPQIDFSNPEHSYAARMGLMLSPDRTSQQMFREGLTSSSHNVANWLLRTVGRRLGKVGTPLKALAGWNDRYQDYLFESYIPGLKYKMFDHAFQRNLGRFRKQLASGELTRDDVAHHTAMQANAAFGHLNYADLGRSPTVQHFMQIFLLAPDFLEARGKFMGQALKGFVPVRGARPSAMEQLSAITLLAALQYGATRIINGLLNEGDMHLTDHPFEIVHGNRVYYLRSVPEDFYKLLKDYKAFINGRLSPVIGRTLWREISGINHRGESTDLGQTIQSVVANFVPMSLQPFTRGLTEETRNNPVSWWEQMLGAMGIRIQRFSPIGEIYPMAEKWMERNAPEHVQKGTFPTSKYTPMRYGLEDSDRAEVGNEVLYLIDKHKMNLKQIHDGFKDSNFKSFTNSQANDYRLYRSLDPEDQKMFEAALERRDLLWKRFTTWVSKKPESKSGKEQLEAMRKAWLDEEKTKPKLPLKL